MHRVVPCVQNQRSHIVLCKTTCNAFRGVPPHTEADESEETKMNR